MRLSTLLRDGRASSTAEFALVLPLLLIFLLGIIDVGRLMWMWNQAEKATQMGARYAVVTNWIPTALGTENFVTQGVVPGEVVPTSKFGSVTCTSAGCTCSGTNCPTAWTTSANFNSTGFTALVAYMQKFLPNITTDSVQVTYSNSGIGYAGDPSGAGIAPLVTVSLRPNSLYFQPKAGFVLFRSQIALPGFQSSLTMEDGQGLKSN